MCNKQILIVKTSSLGDLVHTLPVVSDIARHYPEIRIDWLAEEAFLEIPRFHPGVRRVIPVALRRWRKNLFNPNTWREVLSFCTKLRATEYHQVIDHQGLIKSAVLSRIARGARWGLDFQSVRELVAAGFYHRRCPVRRDQHAVARNRELAARALGYEIPTYPPNYGIVQTFPGVKTEPRRVICLHATSRPEKNWPQEHWITLGKFLAHQGKICLFPWGNIAERYAAQFLVASIPQARVLPQLSLRDLAEILATAQLVIGVDTGLTHLAVALGRPTIALYCDTDPQKTGVVAGDGGWAVNLGGPGKIPAPEEVGTIVDTL